MRIEALAAAAGVAVDWKPFLLGPIFDAQGWNTSPFNLYPAKGRYMVRDMERLRPSAGLPFTHAGTVPAEQPAGGAAGAGRPSTRAGSLRSRKRRLSAEFGDGLRHLRPQGVLADILRGLQLDPEPTVARSAEPEIKERLKRADGRGAGAGIFGAPSFLGERRAVLGRRSAGTCLGSTRPRISEMSDCRRFLLG